jgi:hypothetical protein
MQAGHGGGFRHTLEGFCMVIAQNGRRFCAFPMSSLPSEGRVWDSCDNLW